MRTRLSAAGLASTPFLHTSVACLALMAIALLSGCGGRASLKSTAVTGNSVKLTGAVHGGEQPVFGATIQLYAVGTTGDGSAATPLLTQKVTTGPYGGFDITGLYTCPTPTSEVYLTATGGNPGLASGTNNTAIAEFALLGQCGQLAAASYVSVNEVTTIASVGALAPFMTSYANFGSDTTDAVTLAADFDKFNEFVDVASGSAPGLTLPANDYGSQLEINTLGDILAPCINSVGGVAGDGSPCGNLFRLATPSGGTAPTDTVGAALLLIKSPPADMTALYNLISANPPYQPTVVPVAVAGSSTPVVPALPVVIVPYIDAPVIAPCSGGFKSGPSVSISDPNPVATVSYKIGTGASTAYAAPFSVTIPSTVTATASATGYHDKSVSCSYSSYIPPPPVLSPPAACFPTSQSVSITSPDPDGKIYYTVDGSNPTSSSIPYTGSFTVTTTETIKAIAVVPGYQQSGIGFQQYYAGSSPYGLTPTFSPGTGTSAGVEVSIGSAGDPGSCAAIYYTLDGTTPTTGSAVYSGPIAINSPTILQALVVKPGFSTGTGGSAAYSINLTPLSTTVTTVQSGLNYPTGVAVDGVGNLYVANTGDPTSPDATGTVTRNGTAIASNLNHPTSMSISSAGDVFIADPGDAEVLEVSRNGVTSVLTGGTPDSPLQEPVAVAVDASNNVYVADYVSNIVYEYSGGTLYPVVGGPSTGTVNGGASYTLNAPSGLAVGAGGVYIGDSTGLYVFNSAGTLTPVQGGSPGAIGIAVNGAETFVADGSTVSRINYGTNTPLVQPGVLQSPNGVAVAPNGNLYVSDSGANTVVEIGYSLKPTNYPTTPAPILSEGPGTYSGIQVLTLSSTVFGSSISATFTPGSTLCLASTATTVNGVTTLPVGCSGTITASTVLNGATSGTASGTYTIALPTAVAPTISLPTGTYTGSQSVTLSTPTTGFYYSGPGTPYGNATPTIYYTLDGTAPVNGSSPTASAIAYTGAFTVSKSETVKAATTAFGYYPSTASTAVYTIK